MERTDEYITILRFIHDSDGHFISGKGLSTFRISYPNIEEDLQRFIEEDLVEYDLNENRYYLAYEGFEALEQITKPKKIVHRSEIEQYQEIISSFGGVKQFHKMTIVVVMQITLLVSIFIYLNSGNEGANDKESKNVLDESALNKIKLDLEQTIDSIQSLKE